MLAVLMHFLWARALSGGVGKPKHCAYDALAHKQQQLNKGNVARDKWQNEIFIYAHTCNIHASIISHIYIYPHARSPFI